MESLPLITIGVSTYNRKDYLQLSLDSLLAQTYKNCEIIVVDDGSTDGTEEMMAEKYPSITYVKKENGGDASAKNMAISLAKGEYIVFNDSDDLFLPDSVERLYEAIRNRPGSISYGCYTTIDEKGIPQATRNKVPILPKGRITSSLIEHIVVNNCGTLIPTSILQNGSRFDSSLRCCYDYKLALELSLKTEFFPLEKPVFLRRRHSSNLSQATYAKQKIVLDVLEEFVEKKRDELKDFEKIIRKRRASLHIKLAREAQKEKNKVLAKEHLRKSLENSFCLKAFFRYLFS